jgi:hypothetical protein
LARAVNADGVSAHCGRMFRAAPRNIAIDGIVSGKIAASCFYPFALLIFARYAESEQDGPRTRLALSTQFRRPS